MGIEQRIPNLTDKELETLQANAVRLSQSGTVQQRQQAETLLPLIDAAMQDRRAARTKADQERRRAAPRRKAAAVSGAREAE